ncbi:Zar1-Like Protein [Manis pentadactyla]|nr:Zar1-Like Protein [Manis pentadactyla]
MVGLLNTLKSGMDRKDRAGKRKKQLEKNEECYQWTKMESLWLKTVVILAKATRKLEGWVCN